MFSSTPSSYSGVQGPVAYANRELFLRLLSCFLCAVYPEMLPHPVYLLGYVFYLKKW